MLLLIPLVMALVAMVRAQKSLNWIQKMPTGYSLNQGDNIRLVLDDFIDVKGARFNTGEIGNFPSTDVIPKINLMTKDVQLLNGNAKSCYQALTDSSGWVYMICDTRYLVGVAVDSTLGNVTFATSIELATKQTGIDANKILNKDKQICGEIQEDGGNFLIPCFIPAADSTPAGDIFVFRIPKPTAPSFNFTVPQNINYTICKNEKPQNVQFTPVGGYLKMMKHNNYWVFYNGYPLGTPVANSLSFLTCALAPDIEGFSTSNPANLVDSLLEGAFTGYIRYFRSLSTDSLFFAIAPSDSANKTIGFGVLTLDGTGKVTGKLTKNATWWNASSLAEFDPKNVYIHVSPSEQTRILLIGDNYLHTAMFTTSTAGDPFINFTSPWTSYWLNCGHKAGTFVSKVVQSTGLFTDPNSRVLIEYRALDGSRYRIQDFTVHFNATRYGCASSTPLEPTQIEIVALLNSSHVFTTNDRGSFYRLTPETILNISVAGTDPSKQIKITASLNTFTTNQTNFEIGMYADATKVNKFLFNADSFKAYNDSTFALPVASANFLANAATYTANVDNVKVRHSTLLTPDLKALAIPTDSLIHRVFAIDSDTYGAVLRFPKNGTEAFYVFWTTWSNDTLVLQNSTAINQLEKGLIFFKAFKLSADAYCIVLKRSFSAGTNTTVVSCWEDKPNGANLLSNRAITDTQEVHDIQILESLSRVDFLMIGTNQGSTWNNVYYYSLDIAADKTIRTSTLETVTITGQYNSYNPLDASFDLWGDQDGSTFISIKFAKAGVAPVLAKYALTFDNTKPMIRLVYELPLENPDIAFCANKNEMILYNPRKRQIYSMRWDVGMDFTDKNRLYYPLKEYGIVFIQQFNCIAEKGFFQILGSNSNKDKFVITYRGGESLNLGRRVHSINKVDSSVNFIESGLGFDQFVTVAGSPGNHQNYRGFIVNWYNGPIFWVNNVGKSADYSFTLKSVPYTMPGSTASPAEQIIKMSILSPVYTPIPKPKEKFVFNTGDTIFLDDRADIQGPVMDVVITGDIANLEITERNNRHKTYNPFNSVAADRIFAEKDYMGLMYSGSKVTFLGDPSLTSRGNSSAPVEIGSYNLMARDLALVTYGNLNEAIAVIKEYVSGNASYCYSLYHMSKTGTGNATVYTGAYSPHLFCIRNDFDSLQITSIANTGDVIVAIRSRKAYISNFIRLLSFSKTTGNKFLLKAQTAILSEAAKNIAEFSLVDTGKSSVAIISYYEGFSGLIIGVWDTVKAGPVFRSSNPEFKTNATDAKGRTLTLNYIRCWYNAAMVADCILVNEGINNYMFQITYNEDLTKDVVTSTAVAGEFELPPMFEIKRIDRGRDHVGFLLQKSVANKARILQSNPVIDKFSDCNNIIAIYKPAKSKSIYTGITCSEWNKRANVDFAMEYDAKEYLYYTRDPPAAPAPAPKRLLQGGNFSNNTDVLGSNFISPIMIKVNGPVDASKVQMAFVGLLGTSDPNPPKLTLDDFRQGAPPAPNNDSGSSFWTWFIIIIIILVVIGGAYAGWMWYQGQSSGSSAGTYSKTPAAGADLEDSRL